MGKSRRMPHETVGRALARMIKLCGFLLQTKVHLFWFSCGFQKPHSKSDMSLTSDYNYVVILNHSFRA